MVRQHILLTTRREGSDRPGQAGAKVAPRGAKIKRRERFKRPPKPRRRPTHLFSAAPVFRSEVLSPWARRLAAFADRSSGSLAEGRNRGRLSLPQRAPKGTRGPASALRAYRASRSQRPARQIQVQHTGPPACRREWPPIRL